MKTLLLKSLPVSLFAMATLSTTSAENSFQETAQYLDLDGPFIAYMDFDGDGQEVGEKLNVIYQDFAASNPQVPSVAIDFPAIFEALGFGSLRATGMSSTELDEGLVRNKSVALLSGEPKGLMGLYNGDPIGFELAGMAPADAATVFSGNLNLLELRESVVELAGLVMGPFGQGMIQQGLLQPIPGTDVVGDDVLEALSGRIDLIMSQDFENIQQPKTMIWARFADAGALADRFEMMLLTMQVEFVADGDGRTADLSALMKDAPMGLFVHLPNDSEDLVVYTDADWVAGFEGEDKLINDPKFQRVASMLPEEGVFFAYNAGFDVEPYLGLLQMNPEIAQYATLIEGMVDLIVGDFLKPNASATYFDGDAMVTVQYSEYSYKQALMAIPAGVGAGIGVTAAIQAQKEAQKAMEQASEAAPAEPVEE